MCRLCKETSESVMHIVGGCKKLAQKSYKERHDRVARRVHWELSKKYGLECGEKWYEHTPQEVIENNEVKLYWDCTIQTDKTIKHNRP